MKFFLALIFTLASVTLAAPTGAYDVSSQPALPRPPYGSDQQEPAIFHPTPKEWYYLPIRGLQYAISTSTLGICVNLTMI
jgi:hypothetical protein